MPDLEHRIENVLFAEDEAVNAALGGSPRETISGTVGRAARDGQVWAEDVVEPIVNAVMRNPEHCQEAAAAEDKLRSADPVADPT